MTDIIIPTIEYTRELINSNCDLDFISRCVLLLIPEIRGKVLNKIIEDKIRENKLPDIDPKLLHKGRHKIRDMTPGTLKEEPTIKKRLLYELKSLEELKIKYGVNANIFHQQEDMIDYEKSYTEVISQTIKGLKNIFTDLNIYNETKETNDIHDNITVHNLIIIDWS